MIGLIEKYNNTFIQKLEKIGFVRIQSDVPNDYYLFLKAPYRIGLIYEDLNLEYQFLFNEEEVFIIDSCGAYSEAYNYETVITKVFKDYSEKAIFKMHNRKLFKDYELSNEYIIGNINELKTKQKNMTSQTTVNRNKQLVVLDISVIPKEMIGDQLDLGLLKKDYNEMYPDYDFLFINTSRINTEGNMVKNQPVYAI